MPHNTPNSLTMSGGRSWFVTALIIALAALLPACATRERDRGRAPRGFPRDAPWAFDRGPSQRTSSTPPAYDNRELVRAAFDRWSAGTGGPFELLADDAEWTIVGSSSASKTYHTKQQFMDEVITPFNARLSTPLKPTVREIHADADNVIVLFDGVATAHDGVQYRNTYSWHMRMNKGKAVKVTAFFDTRLFDEFWNRVAPAR